MRCDPALHTGWTRQGRSVRLGSLYLSNLLEAEPANCGTSLSLAEGFLKNSYSSRTRGRLWSGDSILAARSRFSCREGAGQWRKLHSRLYEGSVGPRPRSGDLHCSRPPVRVADREEKRVTKETCNSIKRRAVTRRSPQISAPINECGHSFKQRGQHDRLSRKKLHHRHHKITGSPE